MRVHFNVDALDASKNEELDFRVKNHLVIGYSGRNMQKTMEHINELKEKLGVEPPKRIPTIFHCANEILTQEDEISVVGSKSSGEIEPVLIFTEDELFISAGSDHTDRELEGMDVSKAKEICPKPMAKTAWIYDDIKDHYDQIELRSWQETNGETLEYQSGKLSDILPVETLKAELDERAGSLKDAIAFGGTVPIIGEFIFGDLFKAEMYDPVLNRKIEFSYRINVLTDL